MKKFTRVFLSTLVLCANLSAHNIKYVGTGNKDNYKWSDKKKFVEKTLNDIDSLPFDNFSDRVMIWRTAPHTTLQKQKYAKYHNNPAKKQMVINRHTFPLAALALVKNHSVATNFDQNTITYNLPCLAQYRNILYNGKTPFYEWGILQIGVGTKDNDNKKCYHYCFDKIKNAQAAALNPEKHKDLNSAEKKLNKLLLDALEKEATPYIGVIRDGILTGQVKLDPVDPNQQMSADNSRLVAESPIIAECQDVQGEINLYICKIDKKSVIDSVLKTLDDYITTLAENKNSNILVKK